MKIQISEALAKRRALSVSVNAEYQVCVEELVWPW